MAEGRFIVQFEEKLDVIEEDIVQYSQELLNILLKDRTTKENIIWATSDYISHGELYAATEQIYASLITGVHSKLIQPRVAKAHEQKNSRTRDKAEVFTPSWICNAQNNLVDEHWFGRPNVFNIPQDNTWTATERIVFPEDKQHTWKHYVDARRIEISCGEAPYLVGLFSCPNPKRNILRNDLPPARSILNDNAALIRGSTCNFLNSVYFVSKLNICVNRTPAFSSKSNQRFECFSCSSA